MIKGHPQQMGMPFFVPGWHGSFGLAGPCGGAYAIRPYMYPAKFAGVRRRPFLLCFLILFLPPFSVTPSRTVPSAT